MKKKLNYRFLNPNTAAATADYILKICLEANRKKAEQAIRSALKETEAEADNDSDGCPVIT